MKTRSWNDFEKLCSRIEVKKLNKAQKGAFWFAYIGFCIFATASIYYDGTFENMSFGPSVFLLILYLIVALALHRYISTNPDDFE